MTEEDKGAYREKARQDEIGFFNQIRDKGGRMRFLPATSRGAILAVEGE